MDHAVFRRKAIRPEAIGDLECELLISSYNPSERVRGAFEGVRAARSIWIVHGEYGIDAAEATGATEVYVADTSASEVEAWLGLVEAFGLDRLSPNSRVIVDITGMMVPHLLVMPLILARCGLDTVEVMYSEPVSYASGSRTQFSYGGITGVRQVQGLEGVHLPPSDSDSLVIGAGYDDDLVRSVAESKRTCQHYVMLGLPSLRPHMYQESQLRLSGAVESLNRFGEGSLLFAPANDPFATAAVLGEHMRRHVDRYGPRNHYLCPVSTKCQALGFAWYFLTEARRTPTSVLYPFGRRYAPDIAVGFARSHVFTLELDCIAAG